MSITSQSQIDLVPGEVEKIIEDDRANQTFLLEVVGSNEVRVDHRKRYAADGTTLSTGQTHTVSNLRGEQLYATAINGPTAIRVREASADVQSQPEANVSVTDTVSVNDVTVDSYTGGPVTVDVDKPDYTTTNSFTFSLSGSLESLPNNSVPPGIDAIVQADPNNADPVSVGDPGILLSPDKAVTLDVTNTDQIQVNGTSNDTVRVLFETT